MDYVFKPKNRNESISWWIQAPFYSFRDALELREIHFKRDEIVSFTKLRSDQDTGTVKYVRPDFEGTLLVRKVPESLWADKGKIVETPLKASKQLRDLAVDGFKYMFTRSAIALTIFLTSLWAYALVLVKENFVMDPEFIARFVNPQCSIECVKTALTMNLILVLVSGAVLLPLAVAVFSFYRSRKIRLANIYMAIRTEAVLIGIVGTILAGQMVLKFVEKDGASLEKMRVINKRLMHPPERQPSEAKPESK